MLPACILKGLNACKRGCNVGFHFCRVFIPPSQTEDHNDNLKLFSSAFSFPYHYIPHTHTHYTHRYIGAYIRIKESNSCSWEIHTHIAFFSQVYFSRVLREVNWLNVEWKVDMWFGTDNIGLWDFHHYEIMPKTEARKTRQRFVGRAKRTSPLISTDLWHCFTWFCIVTDDPGLAQGDHFHLVPCLWVTLSLSLSTPSYYHFSNLLGAELFDHCTGISDSNLILTLCYVHVDAVT